MDYAVSSFTSFALASPDMQDPLVVKLEQRISNAIWKWLCFHNSTKMYPFIPLHHHLAFKSPKLNGQLILWKAPKQSHWCCSDVFIVNCEHYSHLFLVFLLLTLNREMFAGSTVVTKNSVLYTVGVLDLPLVLKNMVLHLWTKSLKNTCE